VIVQVVSAVEARAIAESDPAVVNGILRVEVLEWLVIDWEHRT
jgi:uncharacterized protein YciI